MKTLDWILVVTTPPAMVGVWFADDINLLRFIAMVWGLNVLVDSIGWVAGYVVYRPRSD